MRKMKNGLVYGNASNKNVIFTQIKYLLERGKDSIKVGPFGSQLSGGDLLNEESDFWVYNQRSVIDKNSKTAMSYISEEKYKAMLGFHVKPNDILITTRGTIGKIFRIPKCFNKGIIHPCIIKFRICDQKIEYDLLQYIFNESDIVDRQIKYLSNTTTIDVIYSDTLKNIVIPLLSKDKQREVKDYLDEKCGEIDCILSDIEKQIEVLEEYKKSVITEAVTRP